MTSFLSGMRAKEIAALKFKDIRNQAHSRHD
jgi:integrase